MRLLLTLLLTLLIPFNAAFAATSGICDALEGKGQHGSHPGHHSHEHGDDASNELAAATGGVSEPTGHSEDHHHFHAHALFAVMLSTPPGLTPPPTSTAPARPLARDFVSVLPARLERPPRTVSRS
jgi:hypothetical protein